ncbi:MAG: hypothetical protein FWD61_03495, partial [Phycisphaerales bacterium]|nr:hypothetical protein [Phycisphaerales bacterium]
RKGVKRIVFRQSSLKMLDLYEFFSKIIPDIEVSKGVLFETSRCVTRTYFGRVLHVAFVTIYRLGLRRLSRKS